VSNFKSIVNNLCDDTCRKSFQPSNAYKGYILSNTF